MANSVSENIRKLRLKGNIKIMSKDADLALNTVVKIETGGPNPTVDTLEK